MLDGKTYTIGVLVQSNFGATRDLKISGKPAGEKILERIRKEECGSSAEDRGSIMTVLATDLPVSERQLYRIIRRCGVGIARTGAYTGHGSGEIMIGFTTANRVDTKSTCEVEACARIKEEKINEAFEAAAEAVEEAILNSMVTAKEKKRPGRSQIPQPCRISGNTGISEINYFPEPYAPARKFHIRLLSGAR